MKYLIDFKDTTPTFGFSKWLHSTFKSYEPFKNFNTYLVECDEPPHISPFISSVSIDEELKTDAQTETFQNKEWWKTYSLREATYDGNITEFERFGDRCCVYLLDSGANNSDSTLFSFNGNTVDNVGHGSAMVDLITHNGLTNATVKSVKIFDADQQPKLSDFLRAIDIIITDYKENGKLGIVNCSWTVERNRYLEGKIQLLIDNGLCVVAAAGNAADPVDLYTPAAMKDVVTVGAYIKNFTPTTMCNTGVKDCWAPSETGTSEAAAICSASFAYNATQYENFDNNWVGLLDSQRINLMKIAYTSHGSAANRIVTFENAELPQLSTPTERKTIPTVANLTDDRDFYVVAAFSSK